MVLEREREGKERRRRTVQQAGKRTYCALSGLLKSSISLSVFFCPNISFYYLSINPNFVVQNIKINACGKI